MKVALKYIEEELADCRAAMKDAKVGDACQHIHHAGGLLVEFLNEPAENRIRAILGKPANQQPRRLRAFRLWRGILTPAFVEAGRVWREATLVGREADRIGLEAGRVWREADLVWRKATLVYNALPSTRKAHAAQCPDCPWDGRTLFPNE